MTICFVLLQLGKSVVTAASKEAFEGGAGADSVIESHNLNLLTVHSFSFNVVRSDLIYQSESNFQKFDLHLLMTFFSSNDLWLNYLMHYFRLDLADFTRM